MQVYIPFADCDRFQGLRPEGPRERTSRVGGNVFVEEYGPTVDKGWERVFDYWEKGKPLGPSWRPLRVEIHPQDEKSEKLPLGDFPLLGWSTVPVLSRHAVDALGELLKGNAELLKLDYPKREYFILNVTRFVDAFDEKKSKYKCFSNGGISGISRIHFHERKLGQHSIFRIPQFPVQIYVTEPFVRRAQEAELVGIGFEQVWPHRNRRKKTFDMTT